ncbi:unnamed protein product [Lactuca saligna]|uniref:Uncharacterized protein n=1 Tax=Lactuca saligna TaxID=75948 RepID=A0AA35VMR4_LACSI|nr:unnamed protein product [Lactuca saligna]
MRYLYQSELPSDKDLHFLLPFSPPIGNRFSLQAQHPIDGFDSPQLVTQRYVVLTIVHLPFLHPHSPTSSKRADEKGDPPVHKGSQMMDNMDLYAPDTLDPTLARNKEIEASLADAISKGMEAKAAAKQAQKDGAKAAKMAPRKAKRIIGPIISSGWDFFEAIYYGGTVTEGFLKGTGTFSRTYFAGYLGEERYGRFGYLVGSEY